MRNLQSKKIFDLGGGDQECDAVGETYRHGPRYELYGRSKPSEAHDDEHQPSHQRNQRKTSYAEFCYDSGHDDNKSSGGTADLHPRTTESGDQEAGDNGGVQAGLWSDTGGDAKGHCQR